LAISKTTPLTRERLKMEFRAEFFNVFNHAEFGNPDTNILDNQGGTFGQILTTADPRIIQFAVRFSSKQIHKQKRRRRPGDSGLLFPEEIPAAKQDAAGEFDLSKERSFIACPQE